MKVQISRTAYATLIGIGFMAAATFIATAEKESKPDEHSLMRAKLDHSKNLMEGLTMENFDQIKKEANALKLLSEIDLWKKSDTPFYKQISGNFRTAVDKMVDAADKKNLDGATLGFNQITMSCVDCHQLIRGGALVTGIRH